MAWIRNADFKIDCSVLGLRVETCMVLAGAVEVQVAAGLVRHLQDAGGVRRQRLVVFEPLVGGPGQRVRHTFLNREQIAED